jgi:hypothetical protein
MASHLRKSSPSPLRSSRFSFFFLTFYVSSLFCLPTIFLFKFVTSSFLHEYLAKPSCSGVISYVSFLYMLIPVLSVYSFCSLLCSSFCYDSLTNFRSDFFFKNSFLLFPFLFCTERFSEISYLINYYLSVHTMYFINLWHLELFCILMLISPSFVSSEFISVP